MYGIKKKECKYFLIFQRGKKKEYMKTSKSKKYLILLSKWNHSNAQCSIYRHANAYLGIRSIHVSNHSTRLINILDYALL